MYGQHDDMQDDPHLTPLSASSRPDQSAGDETEGMHLWRVIFEVDAPPPNAVGVDVKGPAIIGRSTALTGSLPDLDLQGFGAASNGISRRHAVLIPFEAGVYLVDLGSTNGTRLNGEALEAGRQYELRKGDLIELGRLKMVVRVLTRLIDSNASGYSTEVTLNM